MSTIERQVLHNFTFDQGYVSTDLTSYPEGVMAAGSKNVFFIEEGRHYIFRGLLQASPSVGGSALFNIAGGMASLNDVGSTVGQGSIFNYVNESLFSIGAGRIYLYGTDTGVNASSVLQIAPKSGIGYSYPTWYTAGFPQPVAPTVRARNPVSPFTGRNNGTYSFKIAAVRSVTGGRSIASSTSAIVKLTNQTVHISFPTPFTNGQDRWAIFGTKAGFGGVGVHYLIKEVALTDLSIVDGIPNSYVFEYDDSDLLPITAYIDDYPPSSGKFAVRLEGYVLIFGVYTNAIQVSLRNFPESYHPEHIGFLPKSPTAVLQDPQGRFAYVSTESSVHMVSVVPSTDNPLVIQTLWSDLGVLKQHNWCSIGGVLFAFTESTGPVTMGPDGSPDTQFAKPVINDMRSWDASSVVVHHIPHLNSVAYSYNQQSYLFNLQNLKWSSPADLSSFTSGVVKAAVVVNRKPYISVKEGSSYVLFEFDKNSFGSETSYVLRSGFVSPNYPERVNVLGLSSVYTDDGSNTVTFNLVSDFNYTPIKSISFSPSNSNFSKYTRWHIPRLYSIGVTVTGKVSNFNYFNIAGISVYGTLETSAIKN
jgi:hypothetical protein